MSDDEALMRWRLVLGDAAQADLGGLDATAAGMDAALDWLYGRGTGEGGQGGPREAGRGPSALTVPEWINAVHELFPKETIERLERDAIEVYGITEIVTDPEVLENLEPNPALLKAVLQTKHLMNEAVLAAAQQLVRKVVAQLMESLAEEVVTPFSGVVARPRSSPLHRRGPLDLRRTLRANLSRYDPSQKRLYVDKTYHFLRRNRRLDEWQVIVVVDQSGSMLDSTIHAAVTAAILSGLPGVKTHLLAFDTDVVDLTEDVADPVKTLMSVQLGGGTLIDKAMAYAAQLVTAPKRTIIALITDFYEGGSPQRLESIVAELVAQGTTVLGLAALDHESVPVYDKDLAGRLVARGAHVGAMTPGQLAQWVAETIGR